MYVCVHYDLFITRVCDGVWKHSFGGYLVLLHSSLITKMNSIYKSTLRYRLQWKHVENELINCLFYLREKLDNIFFNVPKSVGGRGVLYWKKYTNCINKWILVMVQSCKYSVNITAKQYGHMLLFIVDMKFIYLISFSLIFCRDFTSTFTQSVLFSSFMRMSTSFETNPSNFDATFAGITTAHHLPVLEATWNGSTPLMIPGPIIPEAFIWD